jgi:hypothetical protein
LRQPTRRLVFIAVVIVFASLIGAVLAVIFEWPTQFDGSGRPDITTGEFISKGTATSIPIVPWLAVAGFALLLRSRRWWGTLAAVGLCLLAVVFFAGSLGEAFADETPYVPRAVLITSGAVGAVLATLLVLAGIAELADRFRTRR